MQELHGAGFPTVARAQRGRVGATARQRRGDRAIEVLVQRTCTVADNVAGPGNRIGGDRRAARQRLDDDKPEGVGTAREDEDVGPGIGGRERFATELAKEASG